MHWPLIYTSQINADKKLSDLLGILTDAFCDLFSILNYVLLSIGQRIDFTVNVKIRTI